MVKWLEMKQQRGNYGDVETFGWFQIENLPKSKNGDKRKNGETAVIF